MSVVDRSFDAPLKAEEHAAMPLAGGVLGNGYQCGMLWGAALAAGAQACRWLGPGPQAEAAAVAASQRLVAAFRARNKHINCSDIIHFEWKSNQGRRMLMQLAKFFVRGGPSICFGMSAGYARAALREIEAAYAAGRREAPPAPVSCAAELARRLGATELQAVMAAGFAGGIGLSGGACGDWGAAVWLACLKLGPDFAPSAMLTFPEAEALQERFLQGADYEFECAKIVGRKFESVADHAAYVRAGGCAKIIAALAGNSVLLGFQPLDNPHVQYNRLVPAPLLATKLFIPRHRPRAVLRPRLVERLNEGLRQGQGFARRLTLISAPAGFGKTTLISEWIAGGQPHAPQARVAWLSLDEGDNDPARFLAYLVAAVQTVAACPPLEGVLLALGSPQPPPPEAALTALLNEMALVPDPVLLVLDDYHVIDAQPVDQALAFLMEHLPPQMHLVLATREDPPLPLARYRARGQLAELRAADLRFTPAEAADFLNQGMGLNLSSEDVAALEARTEGWIAGLQLAALALQGATLPGHPDPASFIKTFTGGHHFVLDYLMHEVLQQQPESLQTFLLRTSILDRLCGPLCDSVIGTAPRRAQEQARSGQETLETLERANLFVVPLDNERRWYRYHHLFGGFLRQRLQQTAASWGDEGRGLAELHTRASQWYEDHGQAMEAFQHATLANDVERAGRLIGSRDMPLHFRGAAAAVLDWLVSLPAEVKDAHPSLWVKSATVSLVAGQTTGVEERLQAAEKALAGAALDERARDLIGQIACARATLALTRYDPAAMIIQARRALEYLPPGDLTFRYTANWALASALMLQGDRAGAVRACQEGIAISEKSGDVFSRILATTNLGQAQALENQLYQAAESYRRVLELSGDHPHPNAGEAHLGLAEIYYEWNDLEAAERHGQQSLTLTRQYDRVIDRFLLSEVFLARLSQACGDVEGARARLAQAEQSARQQNFLLRLPEIAAAQGLVWLRLGKPEAAAELAQAHDLPLLRARALLAQGEAAAALAGLDQLRQQREARGWQDERLRVIVLQAVALGQTQGQKDLAAERLAEALQLAEPGGFVRLFVDEGRPVEALLAEAAARGVMPDYTSKLLRAFGQERQPEEGAAAERGARGRGEPLSERELKILQLIAQGLSNQEIAERLYLALDTIKGHNRRIFDKLRVQRRTEAVARARELGLL